MLLSGSILRDHKEALLLPESVCVALSSAGGGRERAWDTEAPRCAVLLTAVRSGRVRGDPDLSTVEMVVAGTSGGK